MFPLLVLLVPGFVKSVTFPVSQIGRLGLLVPLFTSTGALRGGCDDASGSVLVRVIAGVF